jgi:hypothetical protein
LGGACSANGGRIANMLVIGKPGGERPQGRPRYRWLDNIKMDFLDI